MINIGIAQINVKIGNRALNQKRVQRWMEEYCQNIPLSVPTGIVLPELWDVGYALEEKDTLADIEGEQGAAFLCSLAQQYGVWFIGGSVLAKTERGIVNRAQIVNSQGTLMSFYDKIHLFPLMDEPKYLVAGQSHCLFEINSTIMGSVICYDLRFPELFRRYALDGVKVLFISAQWPLVRVKHWTTLLQARAIENMMYIVACNRVGTSKETVFGGNSMIVDPWGEVLYQGSSDAEEGQFTQFNPNTVDAVRAKLKVFSMRKPELY